MKNFIAAMFLAVVMVLPTCTKWEVLEPIGDVLSIEKLNVHIQFLFDDQRIEVSNENWNSADVRIERKIGWGEYTDVYHRWISGRSKESETAYFNHGDKLWLRVTLSEPGADIVRNSYFELGKIVVGCVIDTVLTL